MLQPRAARQELIPSRGEQRKQIIQAIRVRQSFAMPPRIYLAGLPQDVPHEVIAEFVRPFGRVLSIRYPIDLLGLSATDAIVEFSGEEEATAASVALQNASLRGVQLRVTRQREYAPPPVGTTSFGRGGDAAEPAATLAAQLRLHVPESFLVTVREVSVELIRRVADNPHLLRSSDFTSRRFEEFIAELWCGFGYEVELTQQTRDGGYDIVAVRSHLIRERYLIECKRPITNNAIGISAVRELNGVVEAERATKGIIVTTSRLTRDAIEFVDKHRWRMDSQDFEGIQRWVQEYLNGIDA